MAQAMRALSIRQPWASAIILGDKDVENRTWRTHYRGPLLVHAGARDDLAGWQALDEMGARLPVDPPQGGIIGIVTLVDCVRNHPSRWAMPDHWHWVLTDPKPLPFRRCPGNLGLFDPRRQRPVQAAG